MDPNKEIPKALGAFIKVSVKNLTWPELGEVLASFPDTVVKKEGERRGFLPKSEYLKQLPLSELLSEIARRIKD